MPTVQLPDGTTALFPDSMAPADIQSAITAHLRGQPPPAAAPQPPGAIQSLLQSLGIPTNMADAKAAADAQNPLKHPLRALAGPAPPVAESIAGYGKRVFSNALDAGQSLAAGNPSQAGLDAINSIPVVGPAVEKMADNATIDPKASYLQQVRQGINPGNVGTAVGTALQVAPALLGGVDTAAPGRALVAPIKPLIPNAARAGAVLSDIQGQMGNTPITLSRPTLDALEQAQKLSDAGHGTVRPLDSLYQRVNQIAPMDFEEARMRQSALSRLTGQDQLSASNWLKGQAKQVGGNLGADMTSNVEQAIGRGGDFSGAMTDYRRAMQIRQFLKASGKVAIGAGGLGSIVRYLHEASK